jgi:hypothetical protein
MAEVWAGGPEEAAEVDRAEVAYRGMQHFRGQERPLKCLPRAKVLAFLSRQGVNLALLKSGEEDAEEPN